MLCDFGVSKTLTNLSAKTKTFDAGTLNYMPPERLFSEPYGSSADVWASGLILFELLTGNGKLAFNGNTKEEILENIITKTSLSFPTHISQETIDLVLSILAKDAAERPTFEQLLSH